MAMIEDTFIFHASSHAMDMAIYKLEAEQEEAHDVYSSPLSILGRGQISSNTMIRLYQQRRASSITVAVCQVDLALIT